MNIPDGFAGPYNAPPIPLSTSICCSDSMLLAPVTTMPMPSMRAFCMLLPCMPRVAGRRISDPCISWNSTSGRYFEASLKFFTCPLAISSLGSTFTVYGVSSSGAAPSGPSEVTLSTR